MSTKITSTKWLDQQIDILRASAEQGDVRQQFNLGMRYIDGRGVKRNPVEGMKWLRMAADRGDAGAQNNMGIFLMRDWAVGVKQDFVEAYFWHSLAKKAGYYNSAREVATQLTSEQVKAVKKRVKAWKPIETTATKPVAPVKNSKAKKPPRARQVNEFDPISEVIDKRLTISKYSVQRLNAFRKARKFVDLPGVDGLNLAAEKKRLSAVLDKLTDKLIKGIVKHPTKLWVLKQFQTALVATWEEDTEAREHFGVELKKLMSILGIDSSDGLIGYYRYGDMVYEMTSKTKD